MKTNLLTLLSALFFGTAFAQIPQDGLQGYYRLDGNNYENSSTANTTPLAPYPTGGFLLPAPNRFGESDMALKLINQYLDTASNPSVYDFSAENSISLCLWLKIDQTIVDWTGVLNNWADFGIGGYYLGITPNQEIRWNINADPPIDGPSVPTNTWMHIAATYDGNTAFLYIDGNLAAQRVFGTNMLSSVYPFTVGTQANNTNNILPGVLDDVLIYNRAVSQSEIMDIMTVLSIEDMEAFGQAVSLSPNPVSSTLKMSYDHHLGTLTRYELRDSKGMLVDQRAINGVQWDIDFSTLAAGFYVVQLHTADGQTLHKKIIKK
ncbi:MAG: hypothetical protein ABR84_00490 [Cryomorphaceae bacterium BACL21 MAG-121220-bin10]|jgi:hypothetical protein|nr:MAG: hypothetical protein ABR84_00490 [Cryomorphaceae bacterium BACL21 MAG-121220-bin10]